MFPQKKWLPLPECGSSHCRLWDLVHSTTIVLKKGAFRAAPAVNSTTFNHACWWRTLYEDVSLDTISYLCYRPSSGHNWRHRKLQVSRLLQYGVLWFKIRQDEMDWWNARMCNRQRKVRKKTVQTSREAHPVSSSIGYRVPFPGGHSDRGVALTTALPI